MRSARGSMRFIETLGRGGFGTVYLVDIETTAGFIQRRAVKILSTEMTAVADVAARQRDEARLLAQLNHDHIVKVFDLIELSGRPAVMMEYVEGADAQQLLRDGPLPPRAATQLISAAAAALEAAYEAPSPRTGQPLCVIHRDIKPANLLVSRHGGVKVLDFGIARAEFDREGKTSSVMYGTARYIPPEQWLYNDISPAVDVYALGVSYLELLTAQPYVRPPLMPDAYSGHIVQMLQRLDPLQQSAQWITQAAMFIERMLAFDPADRPSAGEVHERMLALIERAPGESLGRLARRSVPPLIETRRLKFAEVPLPAPITFSQPTIATAPLPEPEHAPLPSPASAPAPAPTPKPTPTPVSLPAPKPATPQRGLILAGAAVVGLIMMFGIGGISAGVYATFFRPEVTPIEPEATAPLVEEPVPETLDEPTVTPPIIQQPDVDPGPETTEETTPPPDEDEPKSAEKGPTTPGPRVNPPPPPTPIPIPEVEDVVEEKQVRRVAIFGPEFGAEIYVDGRLAGKSPNVNIELEYGKHSVLIRSKQYGEVRGQIEVGETTASTYRWRSGTNTLSSDK